MYLSSPIRQAQLFVLIAGISADIAIGSIAQDGTARLPRVHVLHICTHCIFFREPGRLRQAGLSRTLRSHQSGNDPGMTPSVSNHRTETRSAVLDALARLRTLFPLEARLRSLSPEVRAAYTALLQQWLRAAPPLASAIDSRALSELTRLDAITPEDQGLGCYPFSAHDTGIGVTLPAGTVNAMCAIDALAVARIAGAAVQIHAACESCGTAVACRVEANGGLDHDQAERARVFWQATCSTHGSCSQSLCRNIRFLCTACAAPGAGEVYTLPQATAIGNAFFGFQHALLHGRPGA